MPVCPIVGHCQPDSDSVFQEELIDMLSRIFIVGTGRSGTWILYRTLGAHKDIHAFPAELRFLIDSGGLLDLIDSLTTSYSPLRARQALVNFEQLMRIHLATPGAGPYAALNLPGWLGEDFYWQALDRFCEQLIEVEYEGWAWDIEKQDEGRLVAGAKGLQRLRRSIQGSNKLPAVPTDKTLKEARYFSNRKQLISLAACFVDELFFHAARANGKRAWCEKTPQHLLHLDFIQELFPESFFIHMKRDPRGVIYSLAKQRWAPHDLEGACHYMLGTYKRWLDLKMTMPLATSNYMEIKLEELAQTPLPFLEQIMSSCSLANDFANLPELDVDKVNYWKRQMSRQEINLVNNILGPHIEQMGYPI